MAADLADPAYRLAVSSNTTMREQELSWQWHVYRLATAKEKIDAKPPYSFGMIRDTEKAALHAKVNSATAFRQHEIQMANNALVSRIRVQKSTYHEHFQKDAHANSTSPLVRDHRAKKLDADRRNGTDTARMGGSSGIYFGARASRNQQRKIQLDNQALLHALKRINNSIGPYNKDKVAHEIEAHERLIRRRLPRLMHAHPKGVIEHGQTDGIQPPIHFSVIAARATSPTKGGPLAGSPPRSPVTAAPHEVNWREYYAQRGLGSSASQPILTQAKLVPTLTEEAKMQSPSQNGTNSLNRSQKLTPVGSRSGVASPPPNYQTKQHQLSGNRATTPAKLTPMAKPATPTRSNEAADQTPAARSGSRPLSAAARTSRPGSAKLAPITTTTTQAKEEATEDDEEPADEELEMAAMLKEIHEEEKNAAAAAGASDPEPLNVADVPLRIESLQSKKSHGFAHVQTRLPGAIDVVLVCEGSARPADDADAPPRALQFTAYDAASTEANNEPLCKPIIVTIDDITKIVPSSMSAFVIPPYLDFTPLLYALRPRFYIDTLGHLNIHLESDFKSPTPTTSAPLSKRATPTETITLPSNGTAAVQQPTHPVTEPEPEPEEQYDDQTEFTSEPDVEPQVNHADEPTRLDAEAEVTNPYVGEQSDFHSYQPSLVEPAEVAEADELVDESPSVLPTPVEPVHTQQAAAGEQVSQDEEEATQEAEPNTQPIANSATKPAPTLASTRIVIPAPTQDTVAPNVLSGGAAPASSASSSPAATPIHSSSPSVGSPAIAPSQPSVHTSTEPVDITPPPAAEPTTTPIVDPTPAKTIEPTRDETNTKPTDELEEDEYEFDAPEIEQSPAAESIAAAAVPATTTPLPVPPVAAAASSAAPATATAATPAPAPSAAASSTPLNIADSSYADDDDEFDVFDKVEELE